MKIVVIDGQGGRIGKTIIEGLKGSGMNVDIWAMGTNSIATSTMLKAGAESFGPEIIELIKSKVIDWIRSQHRFYGLLSLILEWES